MRLWYVVPLRSRKLPPVTDAFRRFVAAEGARLIRKHERSQA